MNGKLANPRVFSWKFAFGIGLGVVVTFFVALAFGFGHGKFFPGITSSLSYLLLYSPVLFMLAAFSGSLALFLGRLIGITLAAVIAIGLSLWMIGSSYLDSQPLARFRVLVWPEAPPTLAIREQRSFYTFNDGTTNAFVLTADVSLVDKLCRAIGLAAVDRQAVLGGSFSLAFSEREFPAETLFFGNGKIQLAYVPAEKAMYVYQPPDLRRS